MRNPRQELPRAIYASVAVVVVIVTGQPFVDLIAPIELENAAMVFSVSQ
jgi:hypothetical protein